MRARNCRDAGVARAVQLGASRLDAEGSGFRVFTDQAGHPFCLTVSDPT